MPEIVKSPTDTREYRALVLNNGLKVMLIFDDKADQAAAALDIQVGSGHDPSDRPGLAHFLEHMLFLGTRQYPGAGEYQQFISAHGGSYNASTALGSTNYFFNIPPNFLEGALNRFAQFFIAPLFNKACINRERSIVHSEYMARKKDEASRLNAARGEIFNPQHPSHKFAAGSLQTLADRANNLVRDDLINFFERFYHAQRMALVVVSHHALDRLQYWVEGKFNAIASPTASPTASHGEAYQPFIDPLVAVNDVPRVLRLKPIKEVRQVTYCFPIESVYPYTDTRPSHYLATFLGHQGQGSLLALLKARAWANSLNAGLGYSDDIQALFDINISLSELGFQHIDEIGEMLFSMIKLLAKKGVTSAYFAELKQMAELDFRFQDKADEARLVQQVARLLHRYEAVEVLSVPDLYGQYDPAAIKLILNSLHPDNVQLIITDPDLVTRKTTQWYDVGYTIDRIGEDKLTRWRQAKVIAELMLPQPNPFIPRRLKLMSPKAGVSEVENKPVKVLDERNIQVWHQTLLRFGQPKAEFYFALRSPVVSRSAKRTVLTTIFVRVLREALSTEVYSARLAGMGYRVDQNPAGLGVRINGYSDQQSDLLGEIVRVILSIKIDRETFDFQREYVRRGLNNELKAHPFKVAINGIYDVLLTSRWLAQEQLSALERLSCEDLVTHVQRLLNDAQWLVLSVGNLSEDDSVRAGKLMMHLSPDGVTGSLAQREKVRKLKAGQWAFITSPAEHSDAAIALIFQGKSKEIKELAATRLIGGLIHSPFFQALRTEAEVGYIVSAFTFNLRDTPALGFSVQSDRHSVNDIADLTGRFLRHYAQTLSALSAKTFAASKAGLVAQLMREDKHLGDIVSRYWAELDREAYDFTTRERLVAEIAAMDKLALCDYYHSLVLDEQAAVLLSVCHGNLSTELASPVLKQAGQAISAKRMRNSLQDYF